jgi:MoaA/NifB/PqqE/SkfB family radical SAM enzyme
MGKKRLYAIPTMHCNLDCDHCFIKNSPEVFNREKFLNEINNFDGEILLFGGEVTSNLGRMFDVIESNNKNGKSKILHVSTNLIILNDRLIEFYKHLGSISTSWNPGRFKGNQYETWKKNCKIISDNKIGYRIMVTLTDDLFKFSAKEFLEIANEWITPTLKEIKFEHYVGDEVTPDYFNKADKWLCEVYNEWNLPDVDLEILNRLNNWKFDCDDIYTLYPDGKLVNSCPHALRGIVAKECYTCDRVSMCRPCRLQPYCSYPHQLAMLVKQNKEGVSNI